MRLHSCLVLAALAVAGAAYGSDVLHVGDRGGTIESIAKAVAPFGKVTKRLANGYFEVRLNAGVDPAKARKAIAKAGMDFVFDRAASQVQPNSLTSVRNYVAYAQGRELIRRGPAKANEARASAGFYDALDHYLSARVGQDGQIDQAALKQAVAQRDAMPPAPHPAWRNDGSRPPTTGWTHQGPAGLDIPYTTYYGTPPLSGRKQGICVAPSNANIIYVASAGGGIWKTTDAGVNWTPCSDSWAFLHTNSVAVHPTNPNIVYAGTGDYVGFFNRQTMGVMKSSDGGATWTQLGLPNMRNRVCTKIIVEPTNPNIITVGTGMAPGSGLDNANSGIYRSTDAGLTWTLVASGSGLNIDDLERGPSGKYWLAATGSSSTGAIARSTDFGATWTTVAHPSGATNHVAIDIAPSKNNANTVYALTSGDEQIWRSTTDGASWTSIKGGTFPNGYAGDPNYNWSQKTYNYWIGTTRQGAEDIVFVGQITVAQWRSTTNAWTDIARSWAQTAPNYMHSDQHSYANHPTNDSIVYMGCDGGIFKYTYAAAPVAANWTSLNNKLKDHQVYAMKTHPSDALYLMAGLQDNATPASRGNLALWKNLLAGDGAWPAFDKVTPGVHYTSWQFGNVSRYPSAASTSPVVLTAGGWSTQFIAPYVVGGTGSQLYGGHDRVRRWNGVLATPTLWTDVTGLVGGKINSMVVAPTSNNAMYAGSTTGTIWRTSDGWATEQQVDDANIDRTVGGLAVSFTNINDVICGLQGSSNGKSRLWRCTNTAAAVPVWTNISGSGGSSPLPDVPINAVSFDPFDAARFYVGTDIGAFMTTNGGATWTNMNVLGLPNVHVNALEINATKTHLYAGTYGRGVWRIGIGSAPSFSISGTVFAFGGGSGLASTTMTLQKWVLLSTSVAVSPGAPIPDNNSTGITANVSTTINTPLDSIAVFVNCTHTYRGDLQVDLVAPDGRVARLQNTSSDSGDNLVKYYDATNTFRGYKPNGTWKVIVRDLFASDTGTFVKTVVYFRYNGWQVQTTQSTPAAGTYSFTGLQAGKYWWYPTKSGKTFTPGSKVATIGPSLTGQNFTANQ